MEIKRRYYDNGKPVTFKQILTPQLVSALSMSIDDYAAMVDRHCNESFRRHMDSKRELER